MDKICFKSINPYEAKFPNRKVLSRSQINLMKYLVSKNYEVTVEPDNGAPVYMLMQKDIWEQIPAILELMGNITIGVVSGIISNYLSQPFSSSEGNNLFLIKGGNSYSSSGQPVKVSDLKNNAQIVRKKFGEAFLQKSPYESSPLPLFLEHSGIVVGWCSVDFNEELGLYVKNIILTSNKAREDISNGVLKGYSIGGLVKKPICSICHCNYIDCEHFTGRDYYGIRCLCELAEVEPAEISLVKSPANSLQFTNINVTNCCT